MAITLKNSWNIPPPRWGSPADVQYAIKVNAENIYGIDKDTIGFSLPMFWGLPLLDRSGKNNHCTNYGATYKDNKFAFDGNDYIDIDNIGSFRVFVENSYTVNLLVRTNLAATRQDIIADFSAAGAAKSFAIEFGGYSQPVNHITTLMGQLSSPAGYLDSGVVYDTNTLYHICVSYNSLAGARTIYVQGKYANSDGIGFSSWISGTDTVIGRAGDCASLYLNGDIKFLNIIKEDVKAAQAALLYDLPFGLYQKVSRPFYLLPIAATTAPPTTIAPTTTPVATTPPPTTLAPTTYAPTTPGPTTLPPTTFVPTTLFQTTAAPTTKAPTTISPTTTAPTTLQPTTSAPTTPVPTTVGPTTVIPTTLAPTTSAPTTIVPTTSAPTTLVPTSPTPTTVGPTTSVPTSVGPTSLAPTTLEPTTLAPTSLAPTTSAPTTPVPTTLAPTSLAPTTIAPTTLAPTTSAPTSLAPTTFLTTLAPTTNIPELICVKNLSSIINLTLDAKSTITKEVTLNGNLC